MKQLSILTALVLGLFAPLQAQDGTDRSLPEFDFSQLELAGEMHFLASDFLEGRRTGSRGNEIASEYIAAQLRGFGYAPINGDSYFQDVPLQTVTSPKEANFATDDFGFTAGKNLLVMRGPAAKAEGKVVFANFGWVDEATGHDDYKDLDVEGKIVITRAGTPEDAGQAGVFQGIGSKAEIAQERGALAVFEIYSLPFPFEAFSNYVSSRTGPRDPDAVPAKIPYGFIKPEEGFLASVQKKKKGVDGMVVSEGVNATSLDSRNVGGILEGTDPDLKDEYMILTAHFDHVGVGKQGGGAYSPQDSIFNGARDNAFGTISLLAAARAFAEEPPRRSIIILAVTGEEMGLLGSKYYADHPLVPLEKTIYNFNTDGAGYNDTSAISLFGIGRTGIDEQIETAAAAFGSRVIGNPAPEQGLYDRSDNVSFAAKGVPALTFSPGFAAFDDAIFKYYHQATDNPETIDMAYLKKYCQIFTLAARLIANRDVRPTWVDGDKYYDAGQKLYGSKK